MTKSGSKIRERLKAGATGLSIQTILFSVTVVFVILIVCIATSCILLLQNETHMRKVEQRGSRSLELARELRQSSDDLTRFARMYAVTGEDKYLHYFQAIMDMRDGRRAHPAQFTPSYWDHVAAGIVELTQDGVVYSIEQQIIELGLTDSEKAKLLKAKKESDDLINLENVAINAVKGRFNDGNGKFTIVGQPNKDMARTILNGQTYLDAKSKINQPIDEFYSLLTERTNREHQRLQGISGALLNGSLFLSALFVVFAIYVFILLKRRIYSSLTSLQTGVRAIIKGDFSKRVGIDYEDEFGALARAFNAMADGIESRTIELSKLSWAIEASPAGVCITDSDGFIEYVNPKLVEITGYTAEEAKGMNLDFFKPEGKHQSFRDKILETTSGGEEWHSNLEYTSRDGRSYWVRVFMAPIISPDGKITNYVVISEDITEQRMAGEIIETQARRMKALHEVISDATLSDAETITGLLREGCSLLGVTTGVVSRVEGEDYFIMHCYGPEEGPRIGDKLALKETLCGEVLRSNQTLALHQASQSEYRNHQKVRYGKVESYMSTPLWVGGRLYGTVRFSGPKPRREPFSSGDKEFIQLVARLFGVLIERMESHEELAEAKNRAEEASRIKSEFLANISHEIRTPLNAIIGFTVLTMETNLSSTQHSYVSKIEGACKKLLDIVNEILDFSKTENGSMEINNVDFELNEILNELQQMISAKARAKGLQLTFDVHQDVPIRLQGDPKLLGRVLFNLSANAVKFTEKGEIVISVTPLQIEERHVLLKFTIRDSGIGISHEQQNNLFHSFQQVDGSSTRKFGGTGLGLAISKKMIDLMGGEIGVVSEIGKGSTFFFIIQFARQDVSAGSDYRGDRLIQPTLKQRGPHPETDGVLVDMEELGLLVQELKRLLLEDNTEAQAVLEKILRISRGTIYENVFAAMIQPVRAYAYEEALAVLEQFWTSLQKHQ